MISSNSDSGGSSRHMGDGFILLLISNGWWWHKHVTPQTGFEADLPQRNPPSPAASAGKHTPTHSFPKSPEGVKCGIYMTKENIMEFPQVCSLFMNIRHATESLRNTLIKLFLPPEQAKWLAAWRRLTRKCYYLILIYFSHICKKLPAALFCT